MGTTTARKADKLEASNSILLAEVIEGELNKQKTFKIRIRTVGSF